MRCRLDGAAIHGAAIHGPAALVIAAAFFGGVARAQISPGPLARAHHSLEGVTKCLSCHELGESAVDAKCLACHREIAALRKARRGYHGISDRGTCASCHPDHGGTEFALIEWEGGDPKSFDHALAGWALEGKHAALECAQCHTTALQKDALVMAVKPQLSPHSFLGMRTDCAGCHEDPHEGRFGPQCAQCHGTADFSVIREAGFDHDKTKYPLRGAHRGLECKLCHDPVLAGGKKPPFRACADCHDDPHGGRATLAGESADCAACHKVERFFPSTFTPERHAKTQFPLAGKHADVDCDGCHRPGGLRGSTGPERAAGLDFRPKHRRCADCHRDPHGGQLAARVDAGACESCHGVNGFTPSRFGAAEHASTEFPLQGAHASAACASCHGPERSELPPPPKSVAIGSARIVFRMEHAACVDCHRDPHEARFSEAGDCLACHDIDRFSPSSLDAERHAAFVFPLEGAHRAVPCFECHGDLQTKRARSTLVHAPAGAALPFAVKDHTCRDCHDDPHGGQFDDAGIAADCAACHGADSFAPAARFDHERDAAFSLKGAHEDVACARCHRPAAKAGKTSPIVYRPISHRCEDCHAVPPGGGKS